ncbi:conserved hypothetical protein [Novosphingobium sp. KN65.2]|nr:conserved hypothetical protein [Novosphingobium sp. KN65.2]
MGAKTAAIHPAMTFTGEPELALERMAGSRFAVTGSDPEDASLAQSIVEALGGISVEIPEDCRALYHAALCHAANHLVTLFADASHALRAAGVEDPADLIAPLLAQPWKTALPTDLTRCQDRYCKEIQKLSAATSRNWQAIVPNRSPPIAPWRSPLMPARRAVGMMNRARPLLRPWPRLRCAC